MVEDTFTTIRVSRETLARVEYWTSQEGTWDAKVNMLLNIFNDMATQTIRKIKK
jgi:hypothetical protein